MEFYKKLSKIINIDVEKYLLDVVDFFNNYNNSILQYYTVISVSYPQEAFDVYYNIEERTTKILEKIAFYKGAMNNTGFWSLLDKIDSIKQKLETVNSYNKFGRVTFIKNKNSGSVSTELYVLKQNQSLENLQNSENIDTWEDLAIFNNLKEEDYTLKGGVLLTLKSSSKVKDNGQPLRSILDIEVGENLLGKDLPEYFEFDSEQNDLKVLTPQETNVFAAKRLLELKRGSIPEFSEIGVQKDILLESSKGEGFLFPLLIRQLSKNFVSDDTIVNFAITNIENKEDSLFISATFSNKLGEVLNVESIL